MPVSSNGLPSWLQGTSVSISGYKPEMIFKEFMTASGGAPYALMALSMENPPPTEEAICVVRIFLQM